MNLDALLRIKADVQGENNIRRLGNSMQGVQGKVKNLQMAVGGLSGALKGLGVALGVGALAGFAKSGLDAADAIGKLSIRTGIAANELFGFQNAAALSDVSTEQLTVGLLQLSKNMLAAAEGSKQYATAFKALGIQLQQQDGQLRDTDEVFREIADRFADLPDGAAKAAVAMRLFGRSGAQLIPLLNGGSESLNQFKYNLSEDFVNKAQLFNDTMAIIGFKFKEIQLQILDYFLPTFQMIGNAFADLFEGSSGDWEAFGKLVEGILRGVGAAVYATVAAIRFLSRVIGDLVKITIAAVNRDFDEVGRIATQGIADTYAQAVKDRNNLSEMLGGGYKNERTQDASKYAARKTGGAFDLSAILGGGDSEARSSQQAAKKAADDYNRALKDAASLAEDLTRKTRDLGIQTQRFGANARQAVELDYKDAMNRAADEADNLARKTADLIAATGGREQFEGLRDRAREYLSALESQAESARTDALVQIYNDETEAIQKATEASWEFAAAQQYNNDILGGLKDSLTTYIDQIGTMREAVTNLALGAFRGLEDALVSLVTTGTANFREFARSVLEATSRMIIQQLILRAIMQAIGAIGGGGGGGGGGINVPQYNASGVTFNPAAFAMGGIMGPDGPMPLKRYASGGVARSPQLALFGEGSMAEAYVPLPDGRRIPVAMQGGGGGNVTVNVDAKGTSVQGDDQRGNQLGRVIAQAVQNELIKQKRPGGLLAAA